MNVVTEQLFEQLNTIDRASQSDRTAMENLTTANATLAHTNADLATKLHQALDHLTCLQQQVNDLKGNKVTHKKQSAPWIHYCWSHGRTTNANHTSNNCRLCKPNHIEYVTYNNGFGGSNMGYKEVPT